ncbi:MAG: TraB/GumN family protein [Niabella sp.]|nr:TraB/GumN family protein [Niabella sp.]
MKTLFTLLLGMLSITLPAQKNILRGSVLWEIKDPKSNNTSYLLGSMHILRADSVVYKFNKIYTLLGSCRLYACESLGMTDSIEAQKFTNAFNKHAKKTFKYWFGKKAGLVDDFFARNFGVKEKISTQVNNEPDLITQVSDIQTLATIVMDSILTQSGLQRHSSPNFDEAISIAMRDAKKPVLQLDSAAFLSENVFSNASFAKDVTGYIKVFEKLAANDTSGLKHNAYYSVVNTMRQYYATATFGFLLKDKINNKAHIERNKAWLKKLIPELEKGDVFAVVGLDHLFMGGHYGLIPELRKRGYIVTPVNLVPVNK